MFPYHPLFYETKLPFSGNRNSTLKPIILVVNCNSIDFTQRLAAIYTTDVLRSTSKESMFAILNIRPISIAGKLLHTWLRLDLVQYMVFMDGMERIIAQFFRRKPLLY